MKVKRIALLPIAGLALAAAFFQFNNASAVVETSWGPQDRETYTWEQPADHVVFNSITDNPYLGDERNFVRVRELGADSESDEVTIEAGKEYQISVYYHNNAAANLNSSGKGISRNTYMRTEFPSYLNKGEIGVVAAFITASNADPEMVWDTTYLKAGESVYLSFVPNSAVIHNNGTTNGTVMSGDALLGDKGITLGHYDSMWGMVPGCNEYGGYVTYTIRADAPAFEVDKEVALADMPDNYKGEITALPGDTLNFRIHYKNTGTTEQTGVTAHDFLPSGLEYIAGTTWARSTRHPEGSQSPEALFGDGLGLGAMIAGEEAWVTYSVKVLDDITIFPCGDTEVYNNAYIATHDGQNSDRTKIIVRRACDTPVTPVTPTELPKTGPGEIVMATIVVIVITGGIIYFYRSRKLWKKIATAGAGGAEMGGTNLNADNGGNVVIDDKTKNDSDSNTVVGEVNNKDVNGSNSDVNSSSQSSIVLDGITNKKSEQ